MAIIANRVRQKAHVFLGAYERMTRLFKEKFGYELYFIGGTLLGYIREGDFLEFEKDMDISYFSKYGKVADVRNELIDIVDSLMDGGEELYFVRRDGTPVENYFRWRVDEKDRIDVMPTWCQEGMIFRPTFVGYPGTADLILPLRKVEFYGHSVNIPNDAERKLANVYGDDWRIPNRGFKKESRKNELTRQVVSKELCYGRSQMRIIRRTAQWKKSTLVKKLYIRLMCARRNPLVAAILPRPSWFVNNFSPKKRAKA